MTNNVSADPVIVGAGDTMNIYVNDPFQALQTVSVTVTDLFGGSTAVAVTLDADGKGRTNYTIPTGNYFLPPGLAITYGNDSCAVVFTG